MNAEAVNHPAHYNAGKIEVIEAIEDWKLGFHLGNVVKYVARSGHKGSELEDLRKARWYLDRYIAEAEGALPTLLESKGVIQEARSTSLPCCICSAASVTTLVVPGVVPNAEPQRFPLCLDHRLMETEAIIEAAK